MSVIPAERSQTRGRIKNSTFSLYLYYSFHLSMHNFVFRKEIFSERTTTWTAITTETSCWKNHRTDCHISFFKERRNNRNRTIEIIGLPLLLYTSTLLAVPMHYSKKSRQDFLKIKISHSTTKNGILSFVFLFNIAKVTCFYF